MIRRDDLLSIARLKGLAPGLAELDYLQDVALISLARECGSRLVFKGGTCLYKLYRLNRFSEDLDFTAQKGFKENLLRRIPRSFDVLGLNATLRRESFKSTTNLYLNVRGPLYDRSKESVARIMLNISRRERVLLPVKRLPYTPLYQEVRTFDIVVMDEREILAEKVRAIYERNKARDVYDLWYLLKRMGIAFDKKLADKKLSRLGGAFAWAAFAAKLDEKEASWKRDLAALIAGELPEFGQVRGEIKEMVGRSR